MKVKQVNLIYFSPTGTTQKTLRKIAEGIGYETKEYDLTSFDARWEKYIFSKEDLVIVGMPVYAGRIPENAVEFFRGIQADNTPAVFVTTYGNRDYDDALLELKNNCEEKGFVGIAAGAFVCEHSFSNKIALGRPDIEDEKKQIAFGQKIKEKIEKINDLRQVSDLEVKGNFPYKKGMFLPLGPVTNDNCDDCGICVKECPMSAINPANPKEVDAFRCINCFACIHNCPKQAKFMDNDQFNGHIQMLVEMCAMRKEPEIFI